MSAGCIKSHEERKRIIRDATRYLREALKILRKYPDPDENPDEIARARGLLIDAEGPDYPDGPTRKPDGTLDYEGLNRDHWTIGLSWLSEHYFS